MAPALRRISILKFLGRFTSGLTLQRKIGLVAIAGLLLAIGVFSYLGITALNRSTHAKLDERLTMATMLADYEDQVLGLALESLEVAALSAQPEQNSILPQRELEILLATYSQLGIPVVGVFALDHQGNWVGEELLAGNISDWNINFYPSLQTTLGTGKPSVSAVVQVPSFDKPVVLLSAPIQSTRGVIGVAVDLPESGVTGFMQPVKLGETGYAELVDENGVVVARTLPGRQPAFFEKSDHPDKFATLIATGQPMVGTCHRCHVEGQQTERRKDILAFAPLDQAAWGVVIRQSEEEALAPIRELKVRLTIAAALMAVMTLLLIWLATSNIVTRIKSLKAASLRMASGDLSTPISISGKDELVTLADSMNSARLELKASYEALQQRTTELSALLAISKTLTSASDLSVMLDLIVAKVVEVISACNGGVLLLSDGSAESFTVKSMVGVEAGTGLLGQSVPATSDQLTGLPSAILRELPAEVSDLAKSVCANILGAPPLSARVKHAVCAPMVNRGLPVGILVLVNYQENKPFTQSDLGLLQTMADEVAIAVENFSLSRQAEEARLLRETDKLKSEFLSTVSHELRTPLASIKGYTTSLLREDVDWSLGVGKEFLKAIDAKSDELRDLIDKLLQMARVEAGGLELTPEPVLMSRMAQEVVSEVSLAHSKHMFHLDFPSPFPVVEGDAHNLKVVLRNLVDNGVKYSPNGGRITISGTVGDKQKEIVISVSDEGIGITNGDVSRIFDRFFRANNEITRRINGSGLGLAVVKAMVEAHNGKVWVESVEGEGSTFYFSLPIEKEPLDRDQDDKADMHTGGGRRSVASTLR